MKKMIAVLLLCIVSAVASAQSALPPADAPRGGRAMQQLQARFARANTTGDGKLTREQADSRHADGRETLRRNRHAARRLCHAAANRGAHAAESNGTLKGNEAGRRVMDQANRIIVLDDEAELRNMLQRFSDRTRVPCARRRRRQAARPLPAARTVRPARARPDDGTGRRADDMPAAARRRTDAAHPHADRERRSRRPRASASKPAPTTTSRNRFSPMNWSRESALCCVARKWPRAYRP